MEPMSITEVSPEQLQARLERGDDLLVVDLRQPWEYHAGHIPGAVSLFIEEVPMRLSELPTDVDIVLQCWHGHTSLDVATYLIQQGWLASRIASLSGGIAGWYTPTGCWGWSEPRGDAALARFAHQAMARMAEGDSHAFHGMRRIATCIDVGTMLYLLAHISTWLPRREGTSPYGAWR